MSSTTETFSKQSLRGRPHLCPCIPICAYIHPHLYLCTAHVPTYTISVPMYTTPVPMYTTPVPIFTHAGAHAHLCLSHTMTCTYICPHPCPCTPVSTHRELVVCSTLFVLIDCSTFNSLYIILIFFSSIQEINVHLQGILPYQTHNLGR